jgi:hypothetical protein
VPSDFVIRTGDQAIFNPTFAPAVAVVLPGTITGTGQSTNTGPIVCVQGDEASVVVPGVVYTSGPYVGGIGTLTITALNADQIAKQTKFLNKPAILKGTLFTARLTVTVPANNSGVPDPTPIYTGNGQFQTSNITLKGT